MSSLLFEVKATDPLTFAGTTVILLGIAFTACVVPAGRATRISPASALKAER
jgi:ABC-type lipoprotein release transport system permease subunit